MTNGIPADFHSVTPHMVIRNASEAIDFYKKAFGAVEKTRLATPDGLIMHAHIMIGNSSIMIMDEMDGSGCEAKSPLKLGGTSVSLHIYVEDVDAAIQKAVAAGAKETMPAQDMFWGDRYGRVQDAYGYDWSLATQVRKLSEAEIKAAAAEACKQPQGAH